MWDEEDIEEGDKEMFGENEKQQRYHTGLRKMWKMSTMAKTMKPYFLLEDG